MPEVGVANEAQAALEAKAKAKFEEGKAQRQEVLDAQAAAAADAPAFVRTLSFAERAQLALETRFAKAFAAAHAATFRGGNDWLTGRLRGDAASGLLWLLGLPHEDAAFHKDLEDVEKQVQSTQQQQQRIQLTKQ